jgi:hypothetical protein
MCVVERTIALRTDGAHVCRLGNTQEYLHSEQNAEEIHQCFLVFLQRKVLDLLDVQRLQDTTIDYHVHDHQNATAPAL